jgi:hypothetical protein
MLENVPSCERCVQVTQREHEEPEELEVPLLLPVECGFRSPSGQARPVAAGPRISFSTTEADPTAYVHHATTDRRPRRNTQLFRVSSSPSSLTSPGILTMPDNNPTDLILRHAPMHKQAEPHKHPRQIRRRKHDQPQEAQSRLRIATGPQVH